MGVLQECPQCRRVQAVKNKVCRNCGYELDKGKQAKKTKYYISYYINGKQKRELIGVSIQEAKDADGKRRSQKREGRIFDIVQDNRITVYRLSQWYLELKDIQKLKSYNRIQTVMENFNKVFGQKFVGDIRPTDLEEYQIQRAEEGRSEATIDMELSITRTMITKAFDNDKISGHAVKAFRGIKKTLKKGSNARKRIITYDEYQVLCATAPPHLRDVIITALHTGMRLGEIRLLRWAYIDREKGFIRLPEDVTKEGREKDIPINYHVKAILDKAPRALKHDFVFTFRGRPIRHKNGLKRAFMTACKKSQIPYGRDVDQGIIFHDLRRSTKTYMVNAGVNEVYRDLILGHALKGMDGYYIKPPDEHLREAMELFTKWMDTKFQNIEQNIEYKWETGK